MHFEHDGKHFKLEFSRRKETVEIRRKVRTRGLDGKVRVESRVTQTESTYPYTQATLWMGPKTGASPIILAQAKVGVAIKLDRYSTKAGRLQAMRALTKVLITQFGKDAKDRKALLRAVWQAYEKIGQPKPKKETPPESTPTPVTETALVVKPASVPGDSAVM